MLKSTKDLKKGMKFVVVSEKSMYGCWNGCGLMDYLLGTVQESIGHTKGGSVLVKAKLTPYQDDWALNDSMIDWKKTNELYNQTKHEKIVTEIGMIDFYINDAKKVVVAKKRGLIGKAKCHPNDTFNPITGMKLAMLRLYKARVERDIKNFLKEI